MAALLANQAIAETFVTTAATDIEAIREALDREARGTSMCEWCDAEASQGAAHAPACPVSCLARLQADYARLLTIEDAARATWKDDRMFYLLVAALADSPEPTKQAVEHESHCGVHMGSVSCTCGAVLADPRNDGYEPPVDSSEERACATVTQHSRPARRRVPAMSTKARGAVMRAALSHIPHSPGGGGMSDTDKRRRALEQQAAARKHVEQRGVVGFSYRPTPPSGPYPERVTPDPTPRAEASVDALVEQVRAGLRHGREDSELLDGRGFDAVLWDTADAALAALRRAEAVEAEVARLTTERDAIGAVLGEPCAECGHIDWRSDGYAENLLAEVARLREGEGAMSQWLIERGQPEGLADAVWLEHNAKHPARDRQWTKIAREAAMFPDRETAELYIAGRGLAARAVEHTF